MKWLDEVKVTTNDYADQGVPQGTVGTIIFSWINDGEYEVVFSDELGRDYADIMISVKHLQVVRSSSVTDADILDDLPGKDPRWWCKVCNGYIVNLKGERKNKIPYDYDS